MAASNVVKLGNSAVGGDLSINMASLLLVEINLCLQDVDFLGLTLELGLKVLFGSLVQFLLLFVLIIEDLLVCAVQKSVKVELVSTKSTDQVKQARVTLDGFSEITLSGRQVSLCFFLLAVALLLHLLELLLKIEHDLRWSTHFKLLKRNDVSKTKKHTLLVLALTLVNLLFLLVDE